ncbi:MAG TPA: hypothetical protein VKP65_18670 [Rhodothermales bacterium]|nr:hypothetical protein [Rhodothermales bacterium]
MTQNLPAGPLEEYADAGLLKRFVPDHGFLFVDRHMWSRLPKYKQVLIRREAQSHCLEHGADVQLRVFDHKSGMKLLI